MHTDGNEQLSVMSYGPGVESFIFRMLHSFINLSKLTSEYSWKKSRNL